MKMQLDSDLIIATLGDISHPRQSLVSTALNNFEVANLNARDSEIGNFK